MKIIEMPIGNVIPYKNNPRRNDKAVKPVMESLKEFGWKQPIVIDKDNVIACEQINRQCYSMELDPVYCDVIVKRWETLTGRKAEVIGGES